MRRKAAVIIGLVGLVGFVLGSCGFQAEQFTGDAALPPPTVGFAQRSSLQDENSGVIQVIVRLSRPAPEEITVNYQFVGGSALRDVDYTGADGLPIQDGTLTFATGETEHGIPLQIAIDTTEEQDETIELALSNPTGAELGESHHTITISAKLLPRVSFSVDQSTGDETGMATLTVELDSAPALASSVTVALKAGGTASTFDFSMPQNLKVDFPINSTSGTISIPITTDTADEDDEDFTIELATSENVVIDPAKKDHKHTIRDDDLAPVVSISASSSAAEGNTGMTSVTLTVTVSPASGKTVTVPIVYGAGTATEGASGDFTYVAKPATLVFMPNQNPALSEVSKTLTIQVNGDVVDEDNQTVVTSLDTPTNGTLTGSPNTVNTYTINNDDPSPKVKFITANQMEFEDDPPNAHTWSYTLQITAASEKTIGFDVNLTGTASTTVDYTTTPATTGTTTKLARMSIAAGTTMATLDLNVVPDKVDEGAMETIIMTISGSNLTNVAKDATDQTRTHTILDADM
jgi:hypothetical protein